jgi:hypothetical protein
LYLIDPLLLLACSVLLVAVSVTALLVAAFPAIQDVSRAARSAEKLFDRLDRELPPTLEAIRLAGLELTDLGEEVAQGVQSASMVVIFKLILKVSGLVSRRHGKLGEIAANRSIAVIFHPIRDRHSKVISMQVRNEIYTIYMNQRSM